MFIAIELGLSSGAADPKGSLIRWVTGLGETSGGESCA